MHKIEVLGKDFKALISSVSKFPTVGSFAGSELVNLQAADGKLTATAFGIVLSRGRVSAEGTLKLVGAGERELSSFAGICPDLAKVSISIVDKQIVLKCKQNEVKMPLVDGQAHKMPSVKDLRGITITKSIAQRVGYLSDIAFNDSSRADLCCVMATGAGEAMAMNQKTLAVLKTSPSHSGNVAIPVPLAKAIAVDDVLYIGAKETIVKSGIALHSMPSPVKAQKEFPLAQIKQFGKMEREETLVVDGPKMAEAVAACASVLTGSTRAEIVVVLRTVKDKLELSARAGGAEFRTLVPTIKMFTEAEFRVPLEGLAHVALFMGKKIVMSRARHGELFLSVPDGWVMFPSWEVKKKDKKK